jgi:hypothetical protein
VRIGREYKLLYPHAIPALITMMLVDYGLYWWLELQCAYAYAVQDFSIVGLADSALVRSFLYSVLAFSLCGIRVLNTSVFQDPPYYRWLLMTPWRLGRPLPFGSMLPAWPDAVTLTLVTGVSLMGPVAHPFYVPCMFIGAYSLFTGAHLVIPRLWLQASLIGMLLVAAMLVIEYPWLLLLVLLLSLGIAWAGLTRRLDTFHHRELWEIDPVSLRALVFQGAGVQPRLEIGSDLGRTHAVLHRDKIETESQLIAGLLMATLTGGAAYLVAMLLADSEHLDDMAFIVTTLVLTCAAIRWFTYLGRAPISIWGPLRTGKIIISNYDRIHIAPLATLLVAGLASYGLIRANAKFEVWAAGTLFVAVLVAWGMPPSRGVHFLTGAQHYRQALLSFGERRLRNDSAVPGSPQRAGRHCSS